jgi:ElaB/YqjD/DUF883 family membrane-anchored ribosome-binding protein
MSDDVAKVIQDSIESVMTETKEDAEENAKQGREAREHAGEREGKVGELLSKYGPKAMDDKANSTISSVAKKVAAEGEGVKDHLVKAGKKALASADDAVKEHPYLSSAVAAALAAGAGGLTAIKRMRKAAKKK